MDRENIHSAFLLGGFHGRTGGQKMAMRILPSEFRELSRAQRNIHVQALEEVCPASRTTRGRECGPGTRYRRVGSDYCGLEQGTCGGSRVLFSSAETRLSPRVPV